MISMLSSFHLSMRQHLYPTGRAAEILNALQYKLLRTDEKCTHHVVATICKQQLRMFELALTIRVNM